MRPSVAALEVFEQVVALPGERRPAALEELCAQRGGLRAEVEALLASDRTTARLPIGRPALGPGFHAVRFACRDVQPIATFPAQVGRYRVEAEIGRGGMGIVYRAEQDRPRRPVALKLLMHGATASLERPFLHREAQALALLPHPGIVHVYDAGTVPVDGADYQFLAMELVDGESLLAWAERNAPDVATRIRILVDVCAAVEAAHRAGVIHRDLKPGNILVETGAGPPRPRVLDFGISALPEADLGDSAFAGTLSHLSPEQAAGVPAADARSDVYALGTVAYQLLTGVSPIDTRDVALAEALRRIREVEPLPLRQRDRALPADLEPVVATALAKSPEARYASARDFARDLERVLAHEPVSVRRPTAPYLLARFARRQRVLCASLVVVALAVVSGLATGWWAYSRATENLDRLVATSRFTVERVVERLSRLAGTSTVRAEALQHLLPQVEECLRLRPTDRAALACEYAIVRQLGDIEVDEDHLAAALPLRQRALRAQERLLACSPDSAEDRAELATAIVRLGDVEARLSGPKAALARYEAVHEVFAALAERYPARARHLDDLAWSCDRLAHLAIEDHDFVRAEDLLRRREGLNERLAAMRPGAAANAAAARAVQCLWAHLERARGSTGEQVRRLEIAIAAARERHRLEPEATQASVELASTLASYVEAGASSLAREVRMGMLEEALGVLDGLLGQEPNLQVAAEIRAFVEQLRRAI